jgi:alanine racemase
MFRYSANEIASVVSGEPEGPGNHLISHLFIDSRHQVSPEESLFVAIKGQHNDGHQFISELYQQGIRNFMVLRSWKSSDSYSEALFIRVDDTLKALQHFAAWHRSRFNVKTIGITGSNGKTIIKEWLHQCLQDRWHITRSPKSYNSQVGVPLSVLLLDENTEMAIFEAGISKPGEMERLKPVIKPSIGIFTNIGEAHQENFSSTAQKVDEKLKLFENSDVLICCKDHEPVWQRIQHNKKLKKTDILTWSSTANADLHITGIIRENDGTIIRALFKNENKDVFIPFTDNASVENAIHVWLLMLYLGLHDGYIREKMARLSPVAMRLEQKNAINNCILINDSYNSDINSLSIALDVLNRQIQHNQKTLILSDIMQSGIKPDILYKKVADLVYEKSVNRMIGIGPAISTNSERFKIPAVFYANTDDFLKDFRNLSFRDEIILLKGSRVFEFEKISALLEEKVHTTRLEINLDALVHNLNYYKSLLPEGTKIMIMVKALSYGSGTYEIASLMQFQKADYLGVAFADEGVSLRQAGITLPVIVMNPDPASFDIMLKYKLEPEIYNLSLLNLFSQAVIRNQEINYPVHIKIDTGMHRLGFMPDEIPDLLNALKAHQNLKIKSVFSHLAAADEQVHDSFTQKQISTFYDIANQVSKQLGYPVIRHILNSGGIERFKDACFDMVRLGIGLYGVSTTVQQYLRNVSSFKSQISQIKTIDKGETIGYGRKGKATKKMKIAIVPVGYADGLDRRLSNGNGFLFVKGNPAPITGNICMDMTMIDISNIEAQEGDEVTIFGDEYPVSRLAEKLGTIPYEILTGISSRVKRVYFHE